MKNRSLLILVLAFALCLSISTAQAATVTIPSIPDITTPGVAGSLSFDMILTGLDSLTAVDNFAVDIQVTSPGSFPVGSLVGPADSNYIFSSPAIWPAGNSNPAGSNTLSVSDGTFTANNNPLGSLLARVTLDYPALSLDTVLDISLFTGAGSVNEISFETAGESITLAGDLNTQVVPIPGSILLLGSGLVGLIGMARRKRS